MQLVAKYQIYYQFIMVIIYFSKTLQYSWLLLANNNNNNKFKLFFICVIENKKLYQLVVVMECIQYIVIKNTKKNLLGISLHIQNFLLSILGLHHNSDKVLPENANIFHTVTALLLPKLAEGSFYLFNILNLFPQYLKISNSGSL